MKILSKLEVTPRVRDDPAEDFVVAQVILRASACGSVSRVPTEARMKLSLQVTAGAPRPSAVLLSVYGNFDRHTCVEALDISKLQRAQATKHPQGSSKDKFSCNRKTLWQTLACNFRLLHACLCQQLFNATGSSTRDGCWHRVRSLEAQASCLDSAKLCRCPPSTKLGLLGYGMP